MAIHPTVMVTPDRRWRISANPAGTAITVERDLVFMVKLSSLAELQAYLHEQGLELADLVSD